MSEKRDLVKIIAIILAILFFILWIISAYQTSFVTQTNQDVSEVCKVSLQNTVTICQSQLNNLQNQWLASFDTLLNCYKNSVSECQYRIPTLNTTLFNQS